MKYLSIAILLMFSTFSFAEGMGGVYSKGYRMGQVTKFSVKGMFSKSGEGNMTVGNESSTHYIRKVDSDGNVRKVLYNPWKFSTLDPNMQKRLGNSIGDFVVIEYDQYRMKSLSVDTDYIVRSVSELSEKYNDVCVAQSFTKGSKSEGARVGRIVKASFKGNFNKTYEVTIQEGNSGNNFVHMSISKDPALFDCVLKYLKAGQKVKVQYSQSHFSMGFNRQTSYDIVKVSPIKTLN